jgi:hypothetical protein
MTATHYVVAAWCAVILLALALFLIASIIQRWASTPYEAKSMRYFRDAKRRGLTTAEASDELRMREAMAGLRRKASAAVLAAPQDWQKILDHEKSEAVLSLRFRPDLARRLAISVRDLPANHILYPDAYQRLHDWWDFERNISIPVTSDMDAALNIVEPS